jgi:hypothetical protein
LPNYFFRCPQCGKLIFVVFDWEQQVPGTPIPRPTAVWMRPLAWTWEGSRAKKHLLREDVRLPGACSHSPVGAESSIVQIGFRFEGIHTARPNRGTALSLFLPEFRCNEAGEP